MIRKVLRLSFRVLVYSVVVLSLPAICTAQSLPPTCTNGDCTPPTCTNGDCSPPECTNGDCTPAQRDCCCVGSNLPGTIRVCCCRSADLAAVNCRESLVLDTADPEFHQTLVDETIEGLRPRNCDALLAQYCNPPIEEICVRRLGRRICERIITRICLRIEEACQYQYCGPEWFPYSEPTPDKVGCEWWDQIVQCTQ